MKLTIQSNLAKWSQLWNQWLSFDALWKFESPNIVQKNIFYGWKHYLYPFWLGGDVKKWDEYSNVLALFVQKTQIGVYGFKLNNEVADKKITNA